VRGDKNSFINQPYFIKPFFHKKRVNYRVDSHINDEAISIKRVSIKL